MNFQAGIRLKKEDEDASHSPFTLSASLSASQVTASSNSQSSDTGLGFQFSIAMNIGNTSNRTLSRREGTGDSGLPPISSSRDTDGNNEFRITNSFNSRQTCSSTQDVSAQSTEKNTELPKSEDTVFICEDPRCHLKPRIFIGTPKALSTAPKSEEQQKSEKQVFVCEDPRIHCSPKIFIETPKTSSARTEEKESSNSFKCDENFECEAWIEDEASAKAKWTDCGKNPGHVKFCPVKELSSEKLLKGYRSKTVLKGIKSIANFTGRIKVEYTSTARPADDIFAIWRRSRLVRWGTGFIYTRLYNNKITNMEFPDDFTGGPEEDSGLREDLSAEYDRNYHEESLTYYLENFFPSLAKENKDTFQNVLQPMAKIARGIKGFFDLIADYNYLCKGGEFGGIFDDNDDLNQLYHNELVKVLMALSVEDTSFSKHVKCLPQCLLESKGGEILLKMCEIKELNFGALSHPKQSPENKCRRAYRLLSRLRKREPIISGISEMFGNSNQENDRNGDYVFLCNDNEGKAENANNYNKFQDASNEDRNLKTKSFVGFDKEPHDDQSDETDGDQSDDTDVEDEIEEQRKYGFNDLFEIVRPCPCLKCKESGKPEPKGYSVNVLTARHVVFDKEEAEKAVVDLFCDDEDEQGTQRLYGVDVHVSSNSGDFAILNCATHDENLIQKLRKMAVTMMKRTEKMKAKSSTPLAVICSHPHGHFKHITVGEWTTRKIFRRKDRLLPLWTSYIYDTPTCPGSSGAPVLILGHKSGTLSLDSLLHPHHGHEEGTLNKSSRLASFYRELDDMNPKMRKKVLEEQEEVYIQTMKDVEKRLKEEAKMLRQSAETAEKLARDFGILEHLKRILT